MKNEVTIKIHSKTLQELVDKMGEKKIYIDTEHNSFDNFSIHLHSKNRKITKKEIDDLKENMYFKDRAAILENEELIADINKHPEYEEIIKVKVEEKVINISSMLVDFKIIANDSIINCETDVKCQIDEFNKFKSSELYFSGHSPAEIEYMRLTQPEIFKHNEESLKDMEANIRYISDIVLNILSYLNLPSTIENTKVKENAIIKHKKNKNGKKKKGTNKSYIYKKQYIIERHDIDKVITLDGDYIKKVYQRRVSEWGVRGHWRTYADGKKVWIKSHTKKSKTPVLEPTINKNKEYKITRVDL